MRVGLVSCSGPKLATPARARELYTSPLFRSSLAHAERHCDRTFVVSARLGLVELDAAIAPYDFEMKRMALSARSTWARNVIGRLLPLIGVDALTHLAMYCGELYAGPLRAFASVCGIEVEEPLAGKQIGQRLSWLKAQNTAGAVT